MDGRQTHVPWNFFLRMAGWASLRQPNVVCNDDWWANVDGAREKISISFVHPSIDLDTSPSKTMVVLDMAPRTFTQFGDVG